MTDIGKCEIHLGLIICWEVLNLKYVASMKSRSFLTPLKLQLNSRCSVILQKMKTQMTLYVSILALMVRSVS